MAPPPTRARLTRERILAVALALADEGGVESLKIRDLGRALGVEGMALYRHVANKHEIVDGILDLVLAEMEPPQHTADWVDDIRRSAMSVHRALIRHPWSIRLLMEPSHLRPARLQYIDALLARLEAAGLSQEETYHAYHVLDGHIVGFSLWLALHTTVTAAQAAASLANVASVISLDDLSSLAQHHRQHQTEGFHQSRSAFEIGLDLILDGLATRSGQRTKNIGHRK